MLWFPKNKRTWLETFFINLLKAGPVPKHVALIMDGNRRYASKQGLEKTEGHACGFNKLAETLGWCLDLGIVEVTLYAFSIENFKRSEQEVNGLMELAREKFRKLLEEKDKIDEYGVCIRVFGNLSLLPKDIQQILAKVVLYSQKNNRLHLNLCMAYTARQEICTAIQALAEGVKDELLIPSDITEKLMERCLFTRHSTDPDLLIRTSGEVRLSDFLLWQSELSVLAFLQVLWPEFSIWHFFTAVLYYQHNYDAIQKAKKYAAEVKNEEEIEQFLLMVAGETSSSCPVQRQSTEVPQKDNQLLWEEREERIKNFLERLESKHLECLEHMRSGLCKQIPFSTFNMV
ncbi:dehydrodolichyl diphosphate synthase complex subunit DHDDS-like [Limulus polyphemus]|uniref:Alkyl transferase n=1 Tax=Limulus polyphemus TaxID=6850 RepID=A0ABM1B844_LIMPO|nr:dehydrodolichyl diphosphate synthase complex subunit DHDDS-like [Limulus polyphemus]